MHIEARLFEFLTAFFALVTVVYGVLTALYANGGIEWAGTTALVLTTGLTLITGTFFRFVARRLDTRPEDYEDAEIVRRRGGARFLQPRQLVAIADRAVGVGHRGRGRDVVAMVDRRGRGVRDRDGRGSGLRVLHRTREALTRSAPGHDKGAS